MQFLLNRISFDILPNLLPWLHNPADEKCRLLKHTFHSNIVSRILHLLVTWGCCVEVRRSSWEPASSNWVMAEASSASSLVEFEASLSLATTTQRIAAMEIKAVANKTKPSMGLDHGQKCEWSPHSFLIWNPWDVAFSRLFWRKHNTSFKERQFPRSIES